MWSRQVVCYTVHKTPCSNSKFTSNNSSKLFITLFTQRSDGNRTSYLTTLQSFILRIDLCLDAKNAFTLVYMGCFH